MGGAVGIPIAILLALFAGATTPDTNVWVDMTTGNSGNRIFLDTSSVSGSGHNRTAAIMFVSFLGGTSSKLECDCAKQTYRLAGGQSWSSDDPANVRRVCTKDFAGLQRFTKKDIAAVLGAMQADRRWVEVPGDERRMYFLDIRPVSVSKSTRVARWGVLYEGSSSVVSTGTFEIDCAAGKARFEVESYASIVQPVCRNDFGGRRVFSTAELKSYQTALVAKHSDLNGTFFHAPTGTYFPKVVLGAQRIWAAFSERDDDDVRVTYMNGSGGLQSLEYRIYSLRVEGGFSKSSLQDACAREADVTSNFETAKVLGDKPTMETSRRASRKVAGVNYFKVSSAFKSYRAGAISGYNKSDRTTKSAFCDFDAGRVIRFEIVQSAAADPSALLDRLVAEGPWPGRRF